MLYPLSYGRVGANCTATAPSALPERLIAPLSPARLRDFDPFGSTPRAPVHHHVERRA